MIIDNKLVIKDLFLNFENKDKISKLHYFADEKLKLVLNGKKVNFKEAFDGFSLNEVK